MIKKADRKCECEGCSNLIKKGKYTSWPRYNAMRFCCLAHAHQQLAREKRGWFKKG